MAYTALARRYRSQSFDEVVAQEPVAQTLHNAIASDRLHHAYLFCGTRGVGKTTMARLFARALNAPDTIAGCPKPTGVEFPDKDVQQRMADAIMRGEDMNVIEIDGASNRGVEDARQLIANASLSPTGNARFKVYIIDEVHMLTREAFNTLLKTMEEPPSHLKFILCTTEPNKVLPTIHSRCQRFDFQNIPTGRIVEHLRVVLQAEKVSAEDAVLYQIARQGNGSMRDALSLLDRLLASGQDPLTAEGLATLLGLPDRQWIEKIVDAIADADAGAALEHFGSMLEKGVALDQALEGLTECWRQLMLISACGADSSLVELDEASRQSAAKCAERFVTAQLAHAVALMENVQRHARASSAPRALVEAALVRLALRERFADLAGLLAGSGGAVQKKNLAALPRPIPAPVKPTASGAAAPRPIAAPVVSTGSSSRPASNTAKPAPPIIQRVPAASAAPAIGGGQVSRDERDRVMKLPLVKQVQEMFDAKLVDIRSRVEPPKSDPDAESEEES